MLTGPAALVLVDLQHGFVDGDEDARRVVSDISRFAASAGERYGVVAASRFRNEPGSAYWRLVGHEMQDGAEVELVREASAVATHVIDKCTYSSATDELIALLDAHGTTEVHVAGVDTDQCVLATVLGLFDHGYEPVLLADLCVSTAGATCHEAGLVATRRAIGEDRVIESSRLLDQ
ncbi:MAG: hydrolase [Thermoleophilia bacterium]|nr:hydrolase [Thermoleophilia bacterium]